ncbi:MAG: phosphoglycerate dehydrogenase [Lachnospiraceae bacterium]|jgi:Phosphoglycerate dehydrogenase and related dehydrogenases|nr:phosphoglycerate dehydrogenase [Lachnospiraceae bacterium]
MYKIGTLNSISEKIFNVFDDQNYCVSENIDTADAILVRSYVMHDLKFADNLVAIGRAGAGVNTIPIDRCAKEGIVVFNTPGANANAVKEMTIAAMLISTRNVLESIAWTNALKGNGDAVPQMGEKGKGQFVGHELKGMTLGVIGLGAIGALVAEAAVALGMNVLGTDPHLSINAALALNNKVKVVAEDELIRKSDIITIHAPLTDETREKYNEDFIEKAKKGVILINFSRAQIGKAAAIIEGLKSGKVKKYVVDFPTDELLGVEGVISMPHLASGSYEAEDNCAIMAAEEVKDFLENGNIRNSVNYPTCDMGICTTAGRIAIFHKNIANMITRFTGAFGENNINITNMLNKSRGEYAYTMCDVETPVPTDIVKRLEAIDGVFRVRIIK